MPEPIFKISGPHNTQCKTCGAGGLKTIKIKHTWEPDMVEICQGCLEKALTVIKYGE